MKKLVKVILFYLACSQVIKSRLSLLTSQFFMAMTVMAQIVLWIAKTNPSKSRMHGPIQTHLSITFVKTA
jgi:hypothetical protein